MKKSLMMLFVFSAFSLFAWHGPPPPHYHHHWHGGYYWGCDRGLGNAAAITSIVANSIGILGALSQPRVVTQPVYVQQPQPVYIQQTVQQPATVVIQNPQQTNPTLQRQPKQIIIHPNGQQTVIY